MYPPWASTGDRSLDREQGLSRRKVQRLPASLLLRVPRGSACRRPLSQRYDLPPRVALKFDARSVEPFKRKPIAADVNKSVTRAPFGLAIK